MNRSTFAAALFSLAMIGPVSAKEAPITFKHEGVTYTYTVRALSDTKRVISGRATPGAPFHLVVSGDTVTGTTDGAPVSFRVSEARGRVAATRRDVTVASR